VIFNGTLKGDEIVFTREMIVPSGPNANNNVGGPLVSATGPDEFTMFRLDVSKVWPGTIRNGPTPRNPTPQPNPRVATLGTRRVATPHWRWRGGDQQQEVRTFTLPGGTFDIGVFDLQENSLAFSFTRPGPADEVTCKLAKQPDGTFKGSCLMGNTNVQLLELVPPDARKPAEPTAPAVR
jgi:hypothetical protein